MQGKRKPGILTFLTVCLLGAVTAVAQSNEPLAVERTNGIPNRITSEIDPSRLVRLQGNVHPLAQPAFDMGPVAPDLAMNRIVLVLKRSAEQDAALTEFMAEQYDPSSTNFHHWLTPEEFGKAYGPSDADIQILTSWLQNQGFTIDNVTKGRVTLEFSGTAALVQRAFHTEIHRFVVNGEEHIANITDPQIPEALAPVVTGISSLHNFFPKPQMRKGGLVKRDPATGIITPYKPPSENPANPAPQFTYPSNSGETREDVTPYDFATIYNVLPLWKAGITGKGISIAISAGGDIDLADVATFQKTFGLPNNVPTVIHNGTDPGLSDGYRGENTLDVEWSGAVAPDAKVIMVVSADTSTTAGFQLSDSYIVDNGTAPVMSASYGTCELKLGTAGNAAYNGIFQQGAAEGISIFESAGDQGSTGCDNSDAATPNAARSGLQVNGMASSPYVTAVGGTDLAWQGKIPTYWNTTNSANGSNVKGYIPETPWNPTCTNPSIVAATVDPTAEAFCNDAYESINYTGLTGFIATAGGSGGVSACTTPTGTTPSTCTGGYAKPAWQKGTGVPADGKRDVPDVSLFASDGYPAPLNGSAYLVCDSSSVACNYTNPSEIIYQEIGGTSASSPALAGIMAMVVQKTGSAQGLANPVFYALHAKENLTSCNSNTVAAGNTCVFYDTTSGNNTVPCVTGSPNCVTKTSGDLLGVVSGYGTGAGYDLATGLGTVNATNLVNAWAAAVPAQAVTLTPASLTFTSTKVGTASAPQVVTVHNTGSAATAVTISNIEFSGADYSSFSGTTNCPASLAAGSTCTVTVTFTPKASGTLTAGLYVLDNATGSPQFAALSGSITTTAPTVSLSPTSLSFASTAVGSTTAAKVVTLKNTGGSSLTIPTGGITITGTDASSFIKSATTCGATLAAGASCTISVEMKPAAIGALTGSLDISDNATGSPQKVTLSGTGTTPPPSVSLTPSSIAFGSTVIGVAATAQTITLKNTGTVTVAVDSMALSGTNASSFYELSNCPSSLAAGGSCAIVTVFKPAATGALTATLKVTDSATGSPQSVTLTGTGIVAPTVTLSATTLTFTSTALGVSSAAQAITVKNTSTSSLTIAGVALSGTNASSFLLGNECGNTLAAGTSCSIYVALHPAAAGTLKATLNITDNATGSPQAVTLTGTGK